MNLISRRSFSKFIGMAVGSIALPGAVKTLLGPIAPEAERVEDLEEIMQGLIKRVRTIRVPKEEGKLFASFLRRFKTESFEEYDTLQKERQELAEKYGRSSREMQHFEQTKENQVIRFWCKFVNDYKNQTTETQKIIEHNLRSLKDDIVPEILRVTKPIVERMVKDREERDRRST